MIRALVPGSPEDLHVREWLSHGAPLRVSAIVWAEFLCGPTESTQLELASRAFQEPVSFVSEDAARAARLFNIGGRRRGSLTDCMIAATAMRNGAALATSNPAGFRRLEAAGLKLIAP